MGAEVIQGDAVEGMRGIADASVDAVLTDPPYCSGAFSEANKQAAKYQGLRSETVRDGKAEWFSSDAMTTNGFLYLMRSVALRAFSILRDGGSMLVFCDWRMYPLLAGCLESTGFRLQNMLVWDKGNAGLGRGFRPQHELIIHLVKGTGVYHSLKGKNVYDSRRVGSTSREHPTQKPVKLLRELVRVAAPKGGLVVDPFCGSGSTGVACVLEDINFIGFEREAGYVETSRQRIEKALNGQPLFGEAVTKGNRAAALTTALSLLEPENADSPILSCAVTEGNNSTPAGVVQ
jgi:DNA modification methylase